MYKRLTHIEFKKKAEYYSSILKKEYKKEVAKASNKKYAKQYYHKLLFLENPLVPLGSFLFNELIYTYQHYNNLNTKTAIKETFDHLSYLINITKEKLKEAIQYHQGNKSVIITKWYQEQIESGLMTLENIIKIETEVISSSEENLTGALGIYLAGKKLDKEYRDEGIEHGQIKHKFQFTRNEQVLALYFLMKSFGLNISQMSDRTKMSALFHLIMGVPFENPKKIKNLSIYKSLSVAPQVVNDDKKLIIYLKNIRVYFEQANFQEAIKLIDKQIQSSTTQLD